MISFLPILTAPLSCIWRAVAVTRSKLFDWGFLPAQSYDIPVICVGNLAVGGTGKTPHVEYLLRLLHAQGYRVAMLSRGYGRTTRGFVLANDSHTAADIGDEPYQIRQNCPYALVAVAERRVSGMHQLLNLPRPPQVVVLDDAFQHRYVRAGLNLLLTDARRLYTRDHLLPWGRLREPAAAARRAQIVVVTKCVGGERPSLSVLPNQQLYYSTICYGENYRLSAEATCSAQPYSHRHVLLVAGIANPEPLRAHVVSQGAASVCVVAFPDHHNFGLADAKRINEAWTMLRGKADGAVEKMMLLTTQKDATRITRIQPALLPEVQSRMFVQPITVQLSAAHSRQKTFNQNILEYVSTNTRDGSVD